MPIPKSEYVSEIWKDGIFSKKVVFCTGGAGTICSAQVRALVSLGCDACIIGRNVEKTESTALDIATAREGARVIGIGGVDVRAPQSLQAAAERCVKELGGIDYVIAGAAGNFLAPILQLSTNAFKSVIDIDVLGSYNTAKATLPFLLESAKNHKNALNVSIAGRMIFLSATIHYTGVPLQTHVSVAKAGIDALSDALAIEMGPRGMTSNVIAPGPIDKSEGLERLARLSEDINPAKGIPAGRLGTVKDIADATVYLFSDAGNFVNGQKLVVDGGAWHTGTANPVSSNLAEGNRVHQYHIPVQEELQSMGPVCNSTLADLRIDEEAIWHGYTFHNIGLVLCAIFSCIATLFSIYLVVQHALHYSIPCEQRHIIRILFMVPIYSCVSFLSYLFYYHSIYYEVLRDCYEAFAIASFFALMCSYTAPSLHDQKIYFRGLRPKPWVWPVTMANKCCGGEKGIFRTPRSGLTWFNIIWLGVFQYCFIRVIMTVVSVITQATDKYCESSLNPAFAHIWTLFFNASAVTIAMYCLIQFYVQLRTDLAAHKPLIKVVSIKLVIFLSFWQNLLISVITSTGILKPSERIAYADYKVGIPSLLLCIEMAIFSILHIFAFPWAPYRVPIFQGIPDPGDGFTTNNKRYQGGFLGGRAYLDAFNPWDMVKAFGRGIRWLFIGRKSRHLDVSYNVDGVGLEATGTDSMASGINPAADPRKYQRLDDKRYEEGANLLAHPQSAPLSSQIEANAAFKEVSVDVSDMGGPGRFEDDPDQYSSIHPSQRGRFDKSPYEDQNKTQPSIRQQDTGYHGSQGS
ncbi:MAG: hypothetical protein M1829_005609 [Trizodia sp. TS-e1964]|nr:MAG: hypothetical protein M1829_005609 [Trizodia sp. TS-e1964]